MFERVFVFGVDVAENLWALDWSVALFQMLCKSGMRPIPVGCGFEVFIMTYSEAA